jgi:hypothetical protein
VPEHEPRVILATGSYIGEGFDDVRFDTLFLAMPISWKARFSNRWYGCTGFTITNV